MLLVQQVLPDLMEPLEIPEQLEQLGPMDQPVALETPGQRAQLARQEFRDPSEIPEQPAQPALLDRQVALETPGPRVQLVPEPRVQPAQQERRVRRAQLELQVPLEQQVRLAQLVQLESA